MKSSEDKPVVKVVSNKIDLLANIDKDKNPNTYNTVKKARIFHRLIKDMSHLMQDKLDQRHQKYPPKDGKDNWVACCSIQYLIEHFKHEVKEFLDEVEKIESNAYNLSDITNIQELKYEAADVCNMSGMIIDKIVDIINNNNKENIKHEFEIKSDFQSRQKK